jgi:hypothetical protein
MIKVKRQGEAPYVSPSFLKELKFINPRLFPLWLRKVEKWVIASQVPRHINRRGYTEEYAVSKDDDYAPLDDRVLRDLRRLFYLKEKLTNLDKHLEEMDEADKQVYNKAYQEYRGMRKECLKKLERFRTSKTFT